LTALNDARQALEANPDQHLIVAVFDPDTETMMLHYPDSLKHHEVHGILELMRDHVKGDFILE
jgi:hypothetical protein